MTDYRYRLFGLTIASELELPELAAALGEEVADVLIAVAAIPPFADVGHQPQPTEGGTGIAIPGVARFVISGGNSIVVDPDPDASPGNVRLFLLGSAIGMLIHQAGMLPLHANAVVIDGRAFAFMGSSGSGKSTLAAWFHDHGCRVVSDDVCVIRLAAGGGGPSVSPGLPRLRLWRDALERSGREAKHFAASYSGDEGYDKFDVPIGADKEGGEPLLLGGIYLLEQADERSIERIEGAAVVEALMANTYRGAYSSVAGQAQAQFHSCVELAMRVPLYRLSRSLTFEALEEDIRIILDHARRIAT